MVTNTEHSVIVAGQLAAAGRARSAQGLVRVALLAAVVLWLVSLHGVRLDRMNDFGLLSVLPVTYWLALAVLVLGFAVTLFDRRIATTSRGGYVLALIAMIHATPTLLYGTLRYAWAWKHVGITDYLAAHGDVAPDSGTILDVYSRWPGFFAVSAFIMKLTGLHSALSYAAWAPPFFNVLMVVPLVLLFRTVTRDPRLVWGAAWIFVSASWVGQDYYSPQAFAFVLYLAVLAVVARRLTPPEQDARNRAVVVIWGAVLAIPVAAIDSSHQLTPLMLVTALAALAIPRRRPRVALLALAGATAAMLAWDLAVAWSFLRPNLASLVQTIGQLSANVTSNASNTHQVSPDQALLDNVDRLLTAAIVVFAVLGFLRWRSLRRHRLALLALSPVPLAVASSYGGEIVLRVYLFALPALALYAAAFGCLPPRQSRARWAHMKWAYMVWLCVVPLWLAALIGGGLAGYYGKERMNYLTPNEVAAVNRLFAIAPPGSLLAGVTGDLPGGYSDYTRSVVELFTTSTAVQQRALVKDPAAEMASLLATGQGRESFLILTRAQEAEVEMYGLLPAGAYQRMEAAVEHSPRFVVVYRNQDAVVLELVPTATP
jgi:hypothetical protein